MAEKQVAPTGEVVANRPTGPETVVKGSAQELIENAPEPTEEGGKLYKVAYPNDVFIVADHPVVSSAGTRLTDEQAKEVLSAAEASGVRIVEVEVED